MVEAREAGGNPGGVCGSPEEAGEWLARETRDGDVVLLKASRGVKLEKALETGTKASGATGGQRIETDCGTEADCSTGCCS